MKFNIPADVPANRVSTIQINHLMLFTGNQKVEYLNNNFYGKDTPSHYSNFSAEGSLS